MSSSHSEQILSQFTKQAVPFAAAAPIRHEELQHIMMEAVSLGSNDNALDVACGPGLLACGMAAVAV